MAGRGKRKYRYNEQHHDQDEDRNNLSDFSYPPHDHRHTHDQVQSSCNINGESSQDHQLSFNPLNLNPHERGPFGLTLNISASLITCVSKLKSTREKRLNNHQQESSQIQPAPNSKPSNIPAVFLNIGFWNWESKNEQDLVVKFYYKKRRLVWEFLDGSLKKKIEIRWAQLSAIKASVDEDKKGRLQIELHQAPEYYNEIGFKAKTHTKWEATQDFTGNRQATICRRHTILFSPGVLDEHFEKLLKSDNDLSYLSLQKFPFHDSPYFCNSISDFSNERSDYGGPPIPLSTYHHNGAVVPNVQNLAPQPITSFYGLASPIPLRSLVDSICKPSTQNQQNNFDPSCNGMNDHVGESNINHALVINEEVCWSPSEIINLHEARFGSNCSMADMMLPNSEERVTNVSYVEQKENIPLAPISNQDDYLVEYLPTEVTMEQTVDSTCRPSTQNQQKNSGSSCNGTNHVENSWLPFQAGMVDSSSIGGVMNHVDDEIFNEHRFMNDGLSSQAEPSSWLHSQVNMHGFHNNGNGQLPLQAFDNGGNGELPFQAFDNGGNGFNNGGNGELPLQGFDNGGNVFGKVSRNGHQKQHIYFEYKP